MTTILCKRFYLICLVGLFFCFFARDVFAANYGDGLYGSGVYGALSSPTPTSTPVPNPTSSPSNSSGSSGSSSNGSGSFTCTNPPPSFAPDLFQINTNNTTATLFLAPAGTPYNNYTFTFGTKPAADMYGGGFNRQNSSGVISFTINYLKPNTKYYFKISAGNGCASGPTSNIVLAKTTNSAKRTAKYYKNTLTSIVSTVARIFKQDKASNAITVLNTGSSFPPNQTQSSNIGQTIPVAPSTNKQQNVTPPTSKKGFFDSIISFFKNLF